MVDEIEDILRAAVEETAPGKASAMAVKDWCQVVQIMMPNATEEATQAALGSLLTQGVVRFDPNVTIRLFGGTMATIAGYYRSP